MPNLFEIEKIQKSIQEFKKLPKEDNEDQDNEDPFNLYWYNVKWYNLSDDYEKYVIFPKKLKPKNFDQGNTGLCFLFSSLSSISTIPGLINKLFGKNEKWWINKSFIVYMFHNNEKTEIIVNDSFPFDLEDLENNPPWIWSKPGDNELFAKIIEKAYLIYKLFFDFGGKALNNNIREIIYGGGKESDAMKILINAKTEDIFQKKEDIFQKKNGIYYYNYEEMFKKIKDYKENKKALITLDRKFEETNQFGHAYSVLAAWEFKKGLIKKQILCIKNPWDKGNNTDENFNIQTLKKSLKNFPELIEFNNKYFGLKNAQRNYIDDLIDPDSKESSSVFVAPLDYLIQNGVYKIQAHIPDYDKHFQSVKEEIELYNKLDKIFHIKQENNVKNVYDSKMDGNLTRTRVLSIGEEDEREIISNCYNNNFYQIKKNGQSYFELERRFGKFKMINLSKMFLNEYMDNNYLLINQKTKERKVVTLEEILNGNNEKDLTGYDLVCFEHKVTIEKNNYGTFLKDVIQPKTLTNAKVQNLEYKKIQYDNGYYIGWTLNDERHGEGKYYWNDGDYYIGNFQFNKINGKGKYVFSDGTYKDGEWENDNFIYGTKTYSNGDYYIGHFLFNERNGKGKYFFRDRTYDDGEWENGNFIYGTKTYSNGDYYIGNFSDKKRHGGGKYVYRNGDFYDGNWENNLENGYGVEKINTIKYEGNFVNGKKHGKFLKYENGVYDGKVEFEYGKEKSICSVF